MKNINPLVSVIIPIYNVEQYLSKCLNSIVHQTYNNLEIICINDGSTDNSMEILKDFSDTRMSVYSQSNQGLSSARNYGLSIAKGDYILFVDSDDYLELDCIKSCINACDGHDLVMFPRYEVDLTTNTKVAIFYNFKHFSKQEFNKLELLEENVNPNCRIDHMTWSKLYKRSALQGVTFPIGRFHEDLATTYKVYGNVNKSIMINIPLYNYVIRPNSISNVKSYKNYIDSILGYEEQRCFYQQYYPEFLSNASNLVIASINSLIRNKSSIEITQEDFLFIKGLLKKIKTLSFKYKMVAKLIQLKLYFLKIPNFK